MVYNLQFNNLRSWIHGSCRGRKDEELALETLTVLLCHKWIPLPASSWPAHDQDLLKVNFCTFGVINVTQQKQGVYPNSQTQIPWLFQTGVYTFID